MKTHIAVKTKFNKRMVLYKYNLSRLIYLILAFYIILVKLY